MKQSLLIISLLIVISLSTNGQGSEKEWHTPGPDIPSYRTCNGLNCNGLIIDTFQNGQLEECAFYINGYKRGNIVRYYENGVIRQIESLDSNGRFIGNFFYYYPNGQLKFLSRYKNGHRILHRGYMENGYLERYQKSNSNGILEFDYLFGDNQDTIVAQTLTDSVNLIYNYLSKYDNGKVEIIGQLKYTKQGWINIGTWYYYDEKGLPLKTVKN